MCEARARECWAGKLCLFAHHMDMGCTRGALKRDAFFGSRCLVTVNIGEDHRRSDHTIQTAHGSNRNPNLGQRNMVAAKR